MILIVASEQDAHVPYVTAKLDSRSAQYFRFDPRHFPATAEICVSYDHFGSAHRLLNYKQEVVDLSQITAVWDRARARPVPAANLKDEHRWWVTEGCSRFLAELWECLDCRWIPNRPIADRDPHWTFDPPDQPRAGPPPRRLRTPSGYNKLHQLAVAGRLGFTVPRTLVTNVPKRFLEFYEECEGRVVSKSVTPLWTTRDGEEHHQYTFALKRRSAANYQSIRYAPVVFQEEICKRLELRVTVVGEKVFPAAIRSQESRSLRHDWRHYPDFGGSRYYFVYSLPAKIEKLCVRLGEALGICFGAIDLIVTPEDDYVFLEVNPNGQWAWIEDFTGLPISDAIAELLIRSAA